MSPMSSTSPSTDHPLVSVLIPAYNVEAYVERALETVLGQTYEHLEVIVIDDGSTDRTLAICEEWARRDGRLHVVSQANAGVSAARNKALSLATGDFIGFVDADDYCELNMYEDLVHAAVHHHADIVSCAYYEEEAGNKVYEGDSGQSWIRDRESVLTQLLRNKEMRSTLWNRIYRRSLFEGVVFPVGKRFEDLMWLGHLFAQSRCSVFVEKPLYHYVYRHDSIVHNKANKIRRSYEVLNAMLVRHEMLPDDISPDVLRLSKTQIVKKCIHFMNHLTLLPPTKETERYAARCMRILRQADYENLAFHNKLKLFFIKHYWEEYGKAYRFYCKLFKIHSS